MKTLRYFYRLGLTPSVCCANNPLVFIDPNGKDKVNAVDPKEIEDLNEGIRRFPENKGVVQLFAQGGDGILGVYLESVKGYRAIRNPDQLVVFLKNTSKIYSENNKVGEESKTTLLVLYSCSSGQSDGIAQHASEKLNLLIVAPSKSVNSDRVVDGGVWNIYYKGELMESFSGETKQIFNNPQKTIEKYEKMYYEKYGNENKTE